MSKYDIGNRFKTNEGYEVEIIDRGKSYNHRIVRFNDNYKHILETDLSTLSRGNIKNPYHRSVYGIGYFGVGGYDNKEDKRLYRLWNDMLGRCYSNKPNKDRTYVDVDVDERWHNLQNFVEDIKKIPFYDAKDENGKVYAMDKDILGLELYSNDTVCFIPNALNNFFTNKQKTNEFETMGVTFNKISGKYHSQIMKFGKKHKLGNFDTIEEGNKAYVKARNEYARELAKKYKGKVEDRVYDALMNYNEEIFI